MSSSRWGHITTPEKLDFALRRDDAVLDNVGLIILDEAHLIGTDPREIRYELLIDRLRRIKRTRNIRFVCLSAFLSGNATELEDFTSWVRDDEPGGAAIAEPWTPTRRVYGEVTWLNDHARLDLSVDADQEAFIPRLVEQREANRLGKEYKQRYFPENDWQLIFAVAFQLAQGGESVMIFCPQKRSVHAGIKVLLDSLERGSVEPLPFDADAFFTHYDLALLNEWLGRDHPVTHCLMLGVAIHHGDLPSVVLSIVERMIRTKAARLIVASPSIAQGINVSASTVIFQSLWRFDPNIGRQQLIPVDEFLNVVGRAGRAFVDIGGQVIYSSGIDATKRAWKEAQWQELRGRASARTLESGLARLVFGLIRAVGGVDEHSVEFLVGYATADRPGTLAAEDPLERDLDELDDAINTVLQGADVPIAQSAARLDDILRGSLFMRTLSRQEHRIRDAVLDVLRGRTVTVLGRYTVQQRRAAYLSGIRVRLSAQFEDLARELAPEIGRLETILEAGASDDDGFRQACITLALRLLEFPSFYQKVTDRVVQPIPIIEKWLSGVPTRDIIAEHGDVALAYIEDGIRYGVVWGVDAVRSAAELAEGVLTLTALFGQGVSDRRALTLLWSGFGSRALATSLARIAPGYVVDQVSWQMWLTEALNAGELPDEAITVVRAYLSRRALDFEQLGGIVRELRFEPTRAFETGDLGFVFRSKTNDGSYKVTDRDLRLVGRGQNANAAASIRHEGARIRYLDNNRAELMEYGDY